MSYPTTPNLSLPLVPDGDQAWGQAMRDAMGTLDAAVPMDGRHHDLATTPILAFYEATTLEVPFNGSCDMVTVAADHECWIRVYGSAAARAADAGRTPVQAAPPGAGLMGQVWPYGPDHLTIDWSPSPVFHNHDATLAPTAYLSVQNMEVGYTGVINLDFINLPREQLKAGGPQGIQGPSGRSLLVGTVPPTALNGQEGDSYFDSATTTFYGPKSGGAWPAGISLQGLPGLPGTPGTPGTNGTNGANGVDGNTILSGTVDPTAAVGVDGNFYVNTATHTFFGPKAAGAWPAGTSLVGPAGTGGGNDITTTNWMWPKTSAVPLMTSNTAPSGVVSASSVYSGTPAWNAFDAAHFGWVTNGTGLGTPQWLQYQFTAAKTILSYSIMPWSNDNFIVRWLTGWHLDGSNDGSTWTTLDTRSVLPKTWVPFMPKYFTVATPGSYLYYRLVITANGGDAYVGLQHLELYES